MILRQQQWEQTVLLTLEETSNSMEALRKTLVLVIVIEGAVVEAIRRAGSKRLVMEAHLETFIKEVALGKIIPALEKRSLLTDINKTVVLITQW